MLSLAWYCAGLPKAALPQAASESGSTVEGTGDVYAARRLLKLHPERTRDLELLKRAAFLEDAYGSSAPALYSTEVAELKRRDPQADIHETCRRGLLVSLREQQPDRAKEFADELAALGDPNGRDLIQVRKTGTSASVELLGGADALNFFFFGTGGAPKPAHILIDVSRFLSTIAPDALDRSGHKEWEALGCRVHEYFRTLSALSALGTRQNGGIEIALALNTKADKQRTEKSLGILGLKLKSRKEIITVKSAEGKPEANKQDALAALAIDDLGIQETLGAGKTYWLHIPVERVAIFPSLEFWQSFSPENQHLPGGIAEALVSDPRMARVFYALHSMDQSTAKLLVSAMPVKTMADRYASELAFYSAALVAHGNTAEVPGGRHAAEAWRMATGASPGEAILFFPALLSHDDGRLIAFFYSLSQLDSLHQQFFTRSPERLKRFYDLFRESPEMRRGGQHRIGSDSFVEFLREVPLNEDLTVDFPGSPEVWMVAKGQTAKSTKLAKLNRKMKRTAPPETEDEILVRLAGCTYKTHEGQRSEMANFMATVHIDAERTEPLSSEAALLLAQEYQLYGGLYAYFTELGNLEAADYRKLFSLADRFNTLDLPTANIRLGQLHAFLAMFAILHERGTIPEQKALAAYRKGIERYLAANGAAAWAKASLGAIDDLCRLSTPGISSYDAAMEALLDGRSAPARRNKAFAEVLQLQNAPSFDALFSIFSTLNHMYSRQTWVDEVERSLGALRVLRVPKEWKLDGEQKRALEFYDTAQARAVLAKIRAQQAKRKQNTAEIEALAGDLSGALESWVELAMVSRIYARYLDPADLLVSEDPMLTRKHEFTDLGDLTRKRQLFTKAALMAASTGEGSYFSGGLGEFSVAAGEARAAGTHAGGRGEAFATAIFASLRGTDWCALSPASLQRFGATVRLAREWIVESAIAPALREELGQYTLGLLSLNRRQMLLDGLDQHDWPAVWQSLTVSDLFFLGQDLLQGSADDQHLRWFWETPVIATMRQVALQQTGLDALGSVAPALNGCGHPRLCRYAPYEDYERYFMPEHMAQRAAELKLYVAWIADNHAWEPAAMEEASISAARKLLKTVHVRDQYDWTALIDGYEKLAAEDPEELLAQR